MGRFRQYAAESCFDGQWFVMTSPYRLSSKRYATKGEAERAIKANRQKERVRSQRLAAAWRAQLEAARAEGRAQGRRWAIDDACGLLDEPHRSTVRALAPDTGGAS
jgi:hypothetical protein